MIAVLQRHQYCKETGDVEAIPGDMVYDATLNYALSLYCLCFSVIKTCNYWKSDTLDSICDHGAKMFNENLEDVDGYNFPKVISIYDADIKSLISNKRNGSLCNNYCDISVQDLKQMILHNSKDNTGFLLWAAGYCITCIFHKKVKTTDYYLIRINEDVCFENFEKV